MIECLLCGSEHEAGLRVCPFCGALHGLKTTAKDLNGQRAILKRLFNERKEGIRQERKRIYHLVKCLIEHEGYDCGETDHILEYLKELAIIDEVK